MKKLFFAIAVLSLLVSCNNKQANQQDNSQADNNFPVATQDNKQQDKWTHQTTIMTSKPMVIDFFADWCGPCKQQAPVLDELEAKHHGEVIFKRVNVDEEAALAQEFGVEAIPTLMFVTPRGEYVTMVGYHDAPDIEARIADLLIRSTAK